jgi:hypothetical protein
MESPRLSLRWLPRLLALTTAATVSVAVLAAPESRDLFNGRDLTGWEPVHDVTFDATNGNLRLVKGMGWLRTDREVGDFILELELRPLVERYDSGLLFRVGLEGKPWPTNGWQVNLRRDMWGALVQGYTRILPSPVEGPDIEDDTPWSKFRLEVRGARALLDINGRRIWETDRIDRSRGYLGIQAEDRMFEFRNMRLQELDPVSPK